MEATAFSFPLRYLLRAWQVVAVVSLVLFTLHVGLDVGGTASTTFYLWVYDGILIFATAASVVRAVAVREERVSWVLIAAALVFWTVADMYYNAYSDTLSYPSFDDGLYLVFYPLIYAALFLFLRALVKDVNKAVWLDGLLAALATAAVGSAIVVEEVRKTSTGESLSVVATNLAYPIGDTLLLALTLTVFTLTGWRPGLRWTFIGLALVALAVADSIYLYQYSIGTYEEGGLLDASWPAAIVLLAWAGWLKGNTRPAVSVEGRSALFTPAVCGLAGIGVLVYGHFHHVNLFAILLAVGALVAVILRTALTVQENTRIHAMQRDYIQQVGHVAEAAAAVEASAFEAATLDPVAAREDELGTLARVFQRMAREVAERERKLKAQVQQLKIEIDEARAVKEVEDITDTDYFRSLQEKAEKLRLGGEE